MLSVCTCAQQHTQGHSRRGLGHLRRPHQDTQPQQAPLHQPGLADWQARGHHHMPVKASAQLLQGRVQRLGCPRLPWAAPSL